MIALIIENMPLSCFAKRNQVFQNAGGIQFTDMVLLSHRVLTEKMVPKVTVVLLVQR